MKIICNLDNYKPWSGAVDTWNTIKDAGMEEEFESMMADCYPDGIDMTGLNDVLWFDSNWVLSSLGLEEED